MWIIIISHADAYVDVYAILSGDYEDYGHLEYNICQFWNLCSLSISISHTIYVWFGSQTGQLVPNRTLGEPRAFKTYAQLQLNSLQPVLVLLLSSQLLRPLFSSIYMFVLHLALGFCSFLEFPIPNNVAFIGEIGLGGELRGVSTYFPFWSNWTSNFRCLR